MDKKLVPNYLQRLASINTRTAIEAKGGSVAYNGMTAFSLYVTSNLTRFGDYIDWIWHIVPI